jgi:hypothetical protein
MDSLFSYENAFRAWRRMTNTLVASGVDRRDATFLGDFCLIRSDDDQLRLQARARNAQDAFQMVENEVQILLEAQTHLTDGPSGGFEDDPLPDVYSAALILRRRYWDRARDHTAFLFRGQSRSVWRVVPSIFRENRDGSPADISTRWRRLLQFTTALRARYPHLTQDQAFATAQHFSASYEANTPTHLIDVTREPLVALFFASANAQDGNIGVVDKIRIAEWEKLVAEGPGHSGAIRAIDVPIVDRIRRQRALFLDTPSTDMYDRYCADRIYFLQKKDLTFRDLEVTPDISSEQLFPIDHDMKQFIEEFRKDPEAWSFDSIPEPRLALADAQMLRDRALAMFPRLRELDPHWQRVLKTICELYAQGPNWFDGVELWRYSIHQFAQCIENLNMELDQPYLRTYEVILFPAEGALNKERRPSLRELAERIWDQFGES